jgi:hypothetical protein
MGFRGSPLFRTTDDAEAFRDAEPANAHQLRLRMHPGSAAVASRPQCGRDDVVSAVRHRCTSERAWRLRPSYAIAPSASPRSALEGGPISRIWCKALQAGRLRCMASLKPNTYQGLLSRWRCSCRQPGSHPRCPGVGQVTTSGEGDAFRRPGLICT